MGSLLQPAEGSGRLLGPTPEPDQAVRRGRGRPPYAILNQGIFLLQEAKYHATIAGVLQASRLADLFAGHVRREWKRRKK
jgi:hypothetical protein